jgi:protocadherin Fat 1/2/3
MLYTATLLDAEKKPFYSLTVSAIDQGNTGTRKQSSAKVKISIQDRNDENPVFETPTMTVYVDENEPAGTILAKVKATDADSNDNAYISYSIGKYVINLTHSLTMYISDSLHVYESVCV